MRATITAQLTYVWLNYSCPQPGSIPVLLFGDGCTQQLQTLCRNPSCSHSKNLLSLSRLFSNPNFFLQLPSSTRGSGLARSASLPEPWPGEDPKSSAVLAACPFSSTGTNSPVFVASFLPNIFCCFNITFVNN